MAISLSRLFRHLSMTRWRAQSMFNDLRLAAIEKAIQQSEQTHGGEIRFAVEAELSNAALWRDQSPRQRAIEVFGKLGVWDTEQNNGVLIYVLLAERDVEIIADRGYAGKVSDAEWTAVCTKIEQAFARGEFEQGAIAGIVAVGDLIRKHYKDADRNELPNKAAVL